MKIKLLCAILSCLLLLPLAVSCNFGKKDETTESSSELTEGTQGSVSNDGSPDPIMEDFDGYQFKVLTRGSGVYTSDDITGELTGSVLSQATYYRNAALEDRYNFEIVEKKDANWLDTAKTYGASGQTEYDMWAFKMADMPALGQEGYIYNLNEVNGMNLDASYYDQTTRQSVSFANYLFFITGDMLYMDDLALSCMFYNPEMWSALRCSDVYGKDIYSLVRDGQWTFEVMKTLAATAVSDMDGDGDYDEKDRWGCGYANGDIFTLTIAFGNQVLEKDADDLFSLNRSEKLINDLTEIFAFFNSPSCIKDHTFAEKTHLFQLLQLANGSRTMIAAGVEYGIVPTPVMNAGNDYHSYVSAYTANCIAIPTTVANIDKTANIIELISYESQSTLVPKFGDYLFSKVSLHKEDTEMVDILKKTRAYENAYVWSAGSIYSTLIELNEVNGEGIANAFESAEEAVEESVKRKLERLQQLG